VFARPCVRNAPFPARLPERGSVQDLASAYDNP